mgnify:CR=1 FL=1
MASDVAEASYYSQRAGYCPLPASVDRVHRPFMNAALPRAREFVLQLATQSRTVMLGTAAPDGEPAAAVAAAVVDAHGAFVIQVSGLAAHARHLSANPRASVLLAEDEAVAAHPLARRRLTFSCRVEAVRSGSEEHRALLAALRARFGEVVDVMAGLPDFRLLRLVPERGRLVLGFGEAYTVEAAGWHRADALQLAPVRPAG